MGASELLVVVTVAHVLLAAEWLLRDRSLAHLAILETYQRTLVLADLVDRAGGGLSVLAHPWTLPGIVREASGYRPPLLMITAQPAMAVFGESIQAAAVANLGWIAVLLWSTARIARAASDEVGGLLAALALGACPAVLGHRGLFLPFLPAAACVAAFTAAFTDDAFPARRRTQVAAGVWMGLAMLARWDVIAVMAAIAAGRFLDVPAAVRSRLLRGCGVAGAVALLVAGWWYATNLIDTFELYLGEGIISTAHDHERMVELSSWDNAWYYPVRFGRHQLGWPLAVLCFAAVVVVVRGRVRGWRTLVLWLVGAWPLYLAVPMKSSRYVLPIVPVFAIALGIAVRRVPARARAAAAWALGAALVAQTLAIVALPGAERVWPTLVNTPAWRQYDQFRWEDALDHGQPRAWTDGAWADVVARAIDALGPGQDGHPPHLLLVEEPLNAYTMPLHVSRRVHTISSLGLLHLDPRQIAYLLKRLDHIALAGPPLDRAVAAHFATQSFATRQLVAVLLPELARREVVYEGLLPDGYPLRVFGPRMR